MIAWMYCVGEGWRSCEDATMSKSLPVASLFCWFCKYEVHELVYFLTFRKNGIMFCFVLLVTEVKVFYLNDPPFCFWYRNIDMSNFCVGLVGGGRDGWGELRSEPRAAHVFFIFQIKKELFIFIFQIKSISKGTFWKKGTKWQSLVNSRFSLECFCTFFVTFMHGRFKTKKNLHVSFDRVCFKFLQYCDVLRLCKCLVPFDCGNAHSHPQVTQGSV